MSDKITMECRYCGSRESIEDIRAAGHLSCCPERSMQPVQDKTMTPRQNIGAHTIAQALAAFGAASNLPDIVRAQAAEIERLRAALRQIADADAEGGASLSWHINGVFVVRIARDALANG